MKLHVVFAPGGLTPADVQGRTVFVIDILRDDIRAAAEPDAHPLLLQFSDRRVTASAAES